MSPLDAPDIPLPMILDRHLAREISGKVLLVGLWLLLVYLFLSMLDELEGGEHGVVSLTLTLSYAIPRMIYELSPMILLIGTILALTILSRQNELVAFQAGGISKTRIIASIVGYSSVFALLIFFWGELVVPYTETKGAQYRLSEKSDSSDYDSGFWYRHQNNFLLIDHIDRFQNTGEIKVYEFDQQGQFTGLVNAESGRIAKDFNSLMLKSVEKIQLKDQQLEKTFADSKLISVNLDSLAAAKQRVKYSELNIIELYERFQVRKSAGLKTDFDELEFWNRLIIPLSMLVMGIFAILFTFRMKLRFSTGHFVLFGLLFGLFYFAVQQSVGYIAILYGLAPILGMALVFILFLSYALMALYRLKN